MYKVKKNLIQNYIIDLINEGKDKEEGEDFNDTLYYGNFGSVQKDEEDLPLEANPQMATQLSQEEPPVDDENFIPSSKQELSLAASRIAKEVPNEKIEFFYRKLHNLLDAALDEDDEKLFQLQEAIDYDAIKNPAHKKAIKGLVDQAIAMASRSSDDRNYMTTDAAATFALQNRIVSRYPDITLSDIIDEIEMYIKDQEDETSEEQLVDTVDDILTNPPGDLTDASPAGSGTVPSQTKSPGKKRRIAIGAKGRSIGTPEEKSTTKKKTVSRKRKQAIEDPDDESLDKRAEGEMMHMMASAYSEFVEMDEYAATWDWTNYQYEAPLLKVMFDLIKILHQLSYRLLQANYINKYGGYIYDPEADVGGKRKGGFVLEKQGPTSRPQAQAMIRRINSDFGLTYETMMRQQNILKMNHQELVEVIERAMIGIFQRVPKLYNDFIQAVAIQEADLFAQGADADTIRNEAFGFVANVLAHKYRGESEVLDRDLINVAIAGIFKRCLLDLPTELGLSPSVTLSLDSIGQKKTQKTDVTYGFNLAGAMKRFEKLRKDPKIAKIIKKQLPPLIIQKITDTLTAKVTKKGSKYNFEDKSTGLGIEVKGTELKKKVNDYVEQRLQGKQPSFDEEPEPQDMGVEPYDEEAEEKEAKARLTKDDFETRKIVKELEKMIASGDWMHIAPLFGFSGAPGVRSWYLRYPERKFMIMQAARSDMGPAGAKRYLEVFRQMRENLADTLITLSPNKPGVLDLMISEITNKTSLSTSDQAMIDLLEEMRNNIEDLSNLYQSDVSYEKLEENNPEELKRLSNTPGGSLLRFAIGSVFDKIIKDMDTKWHEEMSDYLELENGLKKSDADRLAYYFTGLKVKPSKGDFEADKSKISKTVQEFTNVGIESKEFFDALRYSQGWFFSTLDKQLREKGLKGQALDNYYSMVRGLTSQPLYTRDKKSKSGFKLDKKVYKSLKKMIEGKSGAISAYLDNLAIEQFQQSTQKKLEKIKSEKPDIFMESFSKLVKRFM